jgi:hypothetical protein
MIIVDVEEDTAFSMISGLGHGQTIARYNDTHCPRAAVSQAIMVEALIGSVPEPYRYFITHWLCGLCLFLWFTRHYLMTS